MIDKYRLDDLRLESGEKGELARWVIQLQTDLDSERRKAGNSPVTPDGSVCKYCGGTGYFRWQLSENMCPCPCKGCTELAAPQLRGKDD